MTILGLVVLLASICNFFLGLFVFAKDSSKKLNRSFGIFGLVTAIWVFSNFMMGVDSSIFWVKNTSALGVLVVISAVFWIFEFCDRKLTGINLSLILGLGLIFFVLSFTDLIVSNVKRVYLGGFEGKTGPFFPFYTVYTLGVLGFIIYALISAYSKAENKKKFQLGYVIVGASMFIGVTFVVSFVLPLFGFLNYTALDSPSSLFFLLFTTLAITKYQLFGIKVLMTQLLVGIIVFILSVQALIAPTFNLKILGFAVLTLFGVAGYFLIKSVLKEVALSDELAKANIELRKLDRAKSEFISMASHQLRTPLSSIKGYVSMMIEGSWGKLKAKQKEKLENVFESNERLIKLVADLMDISKIELGKMTMEKKMVQIEETVESCCKELKDIAEKKGLKLYFEKPEKPLPQIEVDNFKIRQAIFNVLDNAIKYTRSGEIKISAQQKDGKVLISVKDTGEGLSNEEKTSIFSGFVRGSAGINLFTEGTGIGLHVARKFLEMHNGKIWAESEGEGKGSTFYIELPVTFS